jgi:hypothetical protein
MTSSWTAPATVAVSAPAVATIVVGVAVALAVVVWFFANRQNPERSASHSDAAASTTSDELYGGADRPAGPDAEVMDPDQLGGDHHPPTSGDPVADADER